MPSRTRLVAAALGLGAVTAAPPIGAQLLGLGIGGFLYMVVAGFVSAMSTVGWVLIPLIALAVALVAQAFFQASRWVAGLDRLPSPNWVDPACESAMLLGMLGTMAGMLSVLLQEGPEQLDPSHILMGLGVALRSSAIGFLLALLGLWLRR